jgi:opacity protein-like surface antigen
MKHILPVLIILLLFTLPVEAQDNTPLNRFSAEVQFGNVMGRQSDYMGPFVGSLGRESQLLNPSLNFSGRYSLSPMLGIQGNIGFFQLRGATSRNPNHPYTSTFTTAGLQTNLYFLRAFETYRTLERINPYVFAGVGGAFGNVSNLPNDRVLNLRRGYLHGGVGAKFYFNELIDFVAQYNYMSFRANDIDGYPRFSGWERGSRLVHFTFGVSVKFGNKERRHADWHIAHSRVDEALRVAREVEARQNQLERRVEIVEDVQASVHPEFRSRLEALEAQRDQMYDLSALEAAQYENNLKIQMLIDRVNALESRGTDSPGTIYVDRSDVVFANVEPGFYVQVYAGARRHHSENALAIIRELFEDVHGIHGLNYIIHKPHRYYVVQIGPYDQMSDTNDILRRAKEVFSDSFVRQYRRR